METASGHIVAIKNRPKRRLKAGLLMRVAITRVSLVLGALVPVQTLIPLEGVVLDGRIDSIIVTRLATARGAVIGGRPAIGIRHGVVLQDFLRDGIHLSAGDAYIARGKNVGGRSAGSGAIGSSIGAIRTSIADVSSARDVSACAARIRICATGRGQGYLTAGIRRKHSVWHGGACKACFEQF